MTAKTCSGKALILTPPEMMSTAWVVLVKARRAGVVRYSSSTRLSALSLFVDFLMFLRRDDGMSGAWAARH